MMMHEKLIPGQFMLDFKNDRSGLLNPPLHPQHPQHSALTAHFLSHHHHLQQQQQQHLHHHHQLQQQPPSPPMSALKMDLYAAYAYQQHQQQQQQSINNKNSIQNIVDQEQQQQQQQKLNADLKSEALDLSRRCDSVETPRKTPSPTHTSSSTSTASPKASPNSTLNHQQPSFAPPIIPSNLLYSMETPQKQMPIPPSLATLYPAFYYSNAIVKPEPICPSSPSTTPPPQPDLPQTAIPPNAQLPITAASELLQTFATAAAVVSNHQLQTPTSPKTINVECKSPSSITSLTTPTSPQFASIDAKPTRPFKAFPRDPLVIAANFAATDVLLDNPRVERYTEYRKRVLEQIRSSNGGARTVTNPKMRRTNSRNVDGEGSSNICRSSSEERHEETGHAGFNNTIADDSSDCDSNAGNFDKSMNATGDPNSFSTNLNGAVTKDAAYYERRRKNNAAAKKSRDRRRIKEDEIAIRAAYLERQNIELLCQIDSLKAQLATFTSKINV